MPKDHNIQDDTQETKDPQHKHFYGEKIKTALFSLANFLEVQGATEPYYVFRHLHDKHDVSAFLPCRPNNGENRARGVKKIPGLPVFVSYNICVLPLLLKKDVSASDIVYTYKGVITPVLVLKFLLGKKWVCDFRTSPVAQEIEFKRANNKFSLFRRFAYFFARVLYRFTLPYCDLVVTISDATRQELIEEYGVSSGRVMVLPLGVAPDLFAPEKGKPEIQDTGLRVVYSGAIAQQRGLDTVIRALPYLKNSIPVKLVIIGRGSDDAITGLKKLSRELDVEELVEWAGFIPHEEVPGFLNSCHVAVSPLPPLRAYEVSSPAKVVEYLATGLPVVATDILAHRRVINHGENGLLVLPQDPEAMASAIERLFYDDHLRLRIGENARQTAMRYSWEMLLSDLERRLVTLAR